MISMNTILALLFSAGVSILLPIVLIIIWRKKTHAPLLPFFTGVAIFIIFALVLESLCHQVVLKLPIMSTSVVAYILYGGLAAGVFEETGRFVAFKWLLRKHNGRESAVAYGIGHGGIEAVLLVGLTMINNLIMAFTLMNHGIEGIATLVGTEVANSIAASFASVPSVYFLAAGVERIAAISLHISLSVLVFFAVQRGRKALFPLAILLHAAVDWFAMLYQVGIIRNIWLLEAGVVVACLVIALLAIRIYRSEKVSSDTAYAEEMNMSEEE